MNKEYSDIIGLNYSGAKWLLKSPAHYQAWLTQPREDTKELRFGRLVHLAVFQPKEFTAKVSIMPPDAPDKPTEKMLEAYAAGSKKQKPETIERIKWWETFNASVPEGNEVISQEEFDHISDVTDASEQALRSLGLDAGVWEAESALTAEHEVDGNKVTIKGRPDLITSIGGRKVVIDLKTTKDASPWSFSADINSFKYHLQAAWYLRMTGADAFIFLAVEKEPPFAWRVYQIDAASLEVGRALMDDACRLYHSCLTFGAWPSYTSELLEISIPKYALPIQK